MEEKNFIKKHKVAIIIIVLFLLLANYKMFTTLSTDPISFITSLVSLFLVAFVIFAIYYCFIQAFIKLRSKQVDKNKGKI